LKKIGNLLILKEIKEWKKPVDREDTQNCKKKGQLMVWLSEYKAVRKAKKARTPGLGGVIIPEG